MVLAFVLGILVGGVVVVLAAWKALSMFRERLQRAVRDAKAHAEHLVAIGGPEAARGAVRGLPIPNPADAFTMAENRLLIRSGWTTMDGEEWTPKWGGLPLSRELALARQRRDNRAPVAALKEIT